ncbi:pyridoxal phosphate-dependent aminotransferase [Acidicapsa ligni]|uniref:pyridoxal phosphate-dependent aminotransferase n=1 Tax=Acidicapsa ligni TaxID=542300 RepID=UPI0021E0D926|nr:pyridoxal phosphate-dependent aminotransferase [Acidicapsa ligni]
MKFSKRTDWNTQESELAEAHRERLAAGQPISDLTASNPTRCGFVYPADLLTPLADAAALDYDPNPKGSVRAREAVCQYYAEHGVTGLDSRRVLLTTSTSEAYGYLFKLLCDPEDQILVPNPSYPLFDYLADAEVVTLAAAPLVYDHGWQLDIEGLRRAVTARTRAVVLVHPNNPTGHFTKVDEAIRLAEVCREFGLALIVDEVFLDYGFGDPVSNGESRTSFLGRELGILVFVVSGISKIVGLPQMKAAWLVATGPGADEAMERLEVLADTYLSMNAPVQRALPDWLLGRAAMQDQIRERVSGNLAELDRQLARQAEGQILVNRLEVEGGWYAILRIPAVQPDEKTVGELLSLGVWAHPGYFFGMGQAGWLVVSLLGLPENFASGILIFLQYFRDSIR